MNNNRKKLIIIGIDGGTFNVITPLLTNLPNLSSFRNSGVLKAPIPPGTAVSWACFSTGNSPGKTGIYDFTIVDENSWKIRFINRKKLNGKTLWEYLNEEEIKSCFINIPVTYPPDKIKGVMISGIDTPSTLNEYVHPKELKKILDGMRYEIEVSALKDKSEIVKQTIPVLEKRMNAARYLIKKDFDFFIVLFRESDVAQHFAWGGEEVKNIYLKIDNFIGEIKDYAKKNNCEIIIMSDHGEEKVDKAFNTNVWLENEGYLKTNIKNKSFLAAIGINRERIFKILDTLKLNFLVKMVPRSLAKKVPTKETDFEEATLTGLIDFNSTKAISKRAVKTSQIFLNKEIRGGIVKKTEEEALKKEIKDRLERYFAKNRINVEIKTNEELYGKEAYNPPDITLYMKEKNHDVLSIFSGSRKLWDKPREEATHNQEGIIFTDLDLKLENARIIDLTPTILDFFNIKGKFDGKSLLNP